MTTTPNRKPLSLSHCEDVLAYVPHALGFHPQNSAVFLLIDGDNLEATLRVDLPESSQSVSRQVWVKQVLRLLGKLAHIHEVALVIYAPDDSGLHEAMPFAELFNELVQDLKRFGVSLRHGWCRQGDLVWNYETGDFQRPMAVQSLETNSTNLAMVFAGSAPLDTPWDGTGIPRWENASQVLDLVGTHGVNIIRSLRDWDSALGMGQSEAETLIHHDHDQAAMLLGSLTVKIVRDMLPYLAGQGLENSMEVLIGVMTGEGDEPASPLTGYLLGRGYFAPDWQRIDRLWNLARDFLGVAEGDSRQALLCILAWIEWARGRGSLSLCLLNRAATENSHYELTDLLQRLMSHGIMPEWATDYQRAWRANLS